MIRALSIQIRGVVQGVGFRPFVFRLAQAHHVAGWVINASDGVEIYAEGEQESLESFLAELRRNPPSASSIAAIDVRPSQTCGLHEFTIRESRRGAPPTAHISPDLPVCGDCLAELFDPANRRYRYPYINCTNCGPRYSVIRALPYDRQNTTMHEWKLDEFCAAEYHDPANRRFHAQPLACPRCGPHYRLTDGQQSVQGDEDGIRQAIAMINSGKIVAIKGIGGYHLACDACNPEAVAALRQRKFRKEKPFALMVKSLESARNIIELLPQAETLLTSPARPIVLGQARIELPGVAPENHELGVMLPYAPLHHLLFAGGAPDILVMTSANRSSEPIAYDDGDARERLSGLADAFLTGERPIARRVEDSVVRAGPDGPTILRRSRGYAPAAAAALPVDRPILALGADLKNTLTLAVDGQAFVSQHLGDLSDYSSFCAFKETVRDLLAMYEIDMSELLLVRDCHPQYFSTLFAGEIPAAEKRTVQHHRAHVASVLAERAEWKRRILGISFDGTGYGDDGSIWGGEIFVGSVESGFVRAGHLRPAALAGGDAAALNPVQAAAGFLVQLETRPDLAAKPFGFPPRFQTALQLVSKRVRTFTTTSAGRLFDTAAALLGFTRAITFEGQAAMWLENLARRAPAADCYPFPFSDGQLDFRPLLAAVIRDRLLGRDRAEIARAFQLGVARGLSHAIMTLCEAHQIGTAVLSGGVFQNTLLLSDLSSILKDQPVEIWTNHVVPPNDGGISLGQTVLAAFANFDLQEQ